MFYGWRIVAACFTILFVIVGIVYYSFPVFYAPLIEEFGWSRAQVTAGFFLSILFVGPLFGVSAGFLIDRYGTKLGYEQQLHREYGLQPGGQDGGHGDDQDQEQQRREQPADPQPAGHPPAVAGGGPGDSHVRRCHALPGRVERGSPCLRAQRAPCLSGVPAAGEIRFHARGA